MHKRVFMALALVGAVVVLPAGAAYAQCGPTQTVGDSIARADVVFIGRVVDRSNRDRTAVMDVLEVWKGTGVQSKVTVSGGPSNLSQQTTVDRTFLLGQIYLVIPANGRSPFQDSLCSGSQLWTTPTGEIPAHLQLAAGNTAPIPLIEGGSGGGGGSLSDPLGSIGVALVVLLVALALVYIFRRLSAPSKKLDRFARRHVPPSTSPTAAFKRRRRRPASFRMPGLFESKRGSRLDRIRRATRRGRKSPGDEEMEQLRRAVKPTATTPPSRRNHYTSGRRSAP